LIRASVKLSEVAVGYGGKRGDAGKQRYDLGTITVFFLLSSQTGAAQSRPPANARRSRASSAMLQKKWPASLPGERA
jgi:hypothetical protein